MKKLSLPLILSISLLACKKEEAPPPPRVKKVVRINVMDTKFIQLDDGSRYGMGENLYNRLITQLKNSNRFVVLVDEPWGKELGIARQKSLIYDPSDRLHFEFAPIAAADFRASIEELTFVHGSRGVKRFAGYKPDFNTPWNNGEFDKINEFPPRSLDFAQGWFGTTFDPIGNTINNTISGVDAGEEGEMNLIIASVHYRRDKFIATAQVNSELRLLTENTVKEKTLNVTGKGFLFALGASWKGLSAEFGIKRNDALKQTFDYEVEGIVKEIQTQLEPIPFRTKIEKYGEQGIILNAGKREGILVGDIFHHKNGNEITKLKVVESFQIGSRVEIESGQTNLKVGDVVELNENTSPTIAKILPDNKMLIATKNEIYSREVKSITLDPPEFSYIDKDAEEALSAKNTILLPWLLIRWAQYDQNIEIRDNIAPRNNLESKANTQWNLVALHTLEAWKNGNTKGAGVKIAVIDSGVDYNHDNLYSAINRNYAGWDMMSYDARPFDDNSHGTAIAGIIAAQGINNSPVGIAPDAQILSYKIFDPYGSTTSAAVYGAFERAIKDGARIIIAAWSTQNNTDSLKEAIKLAQENNVLVITAAGDRGSDLKDEPNFPAVYGNNNHVITVAALNKAGTLSTAYARYSNYGVGYVDIAAPGENLDVLAPRSEYLVRGGSDIAAAHVAGVAALVAAKHPTASAEELKNLLLKGCVNNPALNTYINNGCSLNAALALQN